MNTFADRFWDRVRNYEPFLQMCFVVDLLFIVLALLAYPFVETGSAAHVLVVLDLVIFFVLLVPLAYMLFQCRRIRLEEDEL